MLMLTLIEVILFSNIYILGTALLGFGRNEEALVEYSKVIEINSEDADAYFNRSIISSILR